MPDEFLDPSRTIPASARDLPRLLDETAAVVDARAQELAAQRARLRSLHVQVHQLTWLLDRDDAKFVDGISDTHKEEIGRVAETVKGIQNVELEIAKLEDGVLDLLGQLRAQSPMAIKSVASLDMSRYSDIIKDIQENHPADAPKRNSDLNRLVQDWVSSAMKEIGVSVQQIPHRRTGDGAIVVLDSPDEASHLAVKFHELSYGYNKGKRRHLDRRHFRIGIATGGLILEKETTEDGELKRFEMAGLVISNAVRLESACRTGEVLIDLPTYHLLSESEQSHYGEEETVVGKRKERFRARRRGVVGSAPWEKA